MHPFFDRQTDKPKSLTPSKKCFKCYKEPHEICLYNVHLDVKKNPHKKKTFEI